MTAVMRTARLRLAPVVGIMLVLVLLGRGFWAAGGSPPSPGSGMRAAPDRALPRAAVPERALPPAAKLSISRQLGAQEPRFAVHRSSDGALSATGLGLGAKFGPNGTALTVGGRAVLRLGAVAEGRGGAWCHSAERGGAPQVAVQQGELYPRIRERVVCQRPVRSGAGLHAWRSVRPAAEVVALAGRRVAARVTADGSRLVARRLTLVRARPEACHLRRADGARRPRSAPVRAVVEHCADGRVGIAIGRSLELTYPLRIDPVFAARGQPSRLPTAPRGFRPGGRWRYPATRLPSVIRMDAQGREAGVCLHRARPAGGTPSTR